MPDIFHVQIDGRLNGQHIAGIFDVFGTAPAELLHNHILGGGEENLAIELP